MKITKELVVKINRLMNAGLSSGLGQPIPGMMCVEAAVCHALGLPHSDDPKCVGSAVRSFKITLNDQVWSSKKARGEGLRRLAVAQLGSNTIDQTKFTELLCCKGVNQILSPMLLYLASRTDCKEPSKFKAHAMECKKASSIMDCRAAAKSAYADASAYSSASAYAYTYAYAYADASAYSSAYAYAYTYSSASAYAYTYAYADADADAYADAYADADVKKHFGKDGLLLLSADIACQALIELKSPGAKWLHLAK